MHRIAYLVMIGVVAVGCTDQPDDPFGEDGSLAPLPPPGKEDGQYHAGLATNIDSSRTDVWKVRNQWEDKDTSDAKLAGIAWPADSGLTWDQKFGKWIGAMEWIPSLDGWSMTVKFTTPWGKTLPSPSLECAETMLFLRITFAAWYGLPLQLEAQDEHGQLIYFGHFGVRTQSGRWTTAPEYAIKYQDYTGTDYSSKWPTDATLRTRLLHGGEDNQPMIAPDAVFGAYLDEIHLNKRVGYFTVLALDYLGSANLADTANTYNLQPEAVRPGDMLLERWQKVGIGHTLVVKDVNPIAPDGTTLDITLISGSMPRRQGVRAAGAQAKGYFTGVYTGGPGTNSDNDAYAKLGGGLKRWRVAKARNGFWTNTWMEGDEAHWINSTDFERIAARPARFQSLLGDAALDQQKTELIAQIADARHHLSQYPASCSAREQREQAFSKLYDVESQLSQKGMAQVDMEQRKLEDYVFAPLDYDHSKTCCWDSSTSAMYDIIMAEAMAEKTAADDMHVCTPPVVFMAQKDDYQRWATYAASMNRAADWKAYTDDEGCTAKGVMTDALATTTSSPYCPAP
jgi:hypothetical protein